MPRARRDFIRRSGFRDASLVVVACEGAVTEPEYFQGLKSQEHNPRLHVEILQRSDPSLSSPAHVLRQLVAFAAEYAIRQGDQLWLVLDRDSQSWNDEMMSDVASECWRRDYQLAVSNPCFEVWLLLHFEDVQCQSEQCKSELLQNADGLLKKLIAERRKANEVLFETCRPGLDLARQRAQALDTNQQDRWPQGLGTRVYRLVESICRRGQTS